MAPDGSDLSILAVAFLGVVWGIYWLIRAIMFRRASNYTVLKMNETLRRELKEHYSNKPGTVVTYTHRR